ncbi:LacI family DNA-binding transcriptional regulator [Micromonospora sp. NBS 11-29]|uniref:LacI family DNA-binding transcriptional regulator n=1 Tax=Micromonospora sp. NBS 11-29 TaxID=1960879 RepID=UPI0015938F79|nr:LacI family DNA-binding transcriptional regulator [Micromonospora sp. NBS 11-29]
MRDVARLAGVSNQTVSRVLNAHPHVRDDTRRRVLAAVQALGYRRNQAARTLVTRRSGTLGIIAYESALYGPTSMLYAIEGAARSAGYFVTVAGLRDLDRRSVLDAVDRLRQQSVEGIITIAPKPVVAGTLAQVSDDLPVVGVGGGQDEALPSVQIDNAAGAGLATRHLLNLGHATVHHVAGPADWPEANERADGWRAALHATGRPSPYATPGMWTARTGYAQGRRLARDPSVTAIFCANDQIALGVLRALHEAGRRVPDEVSVVGFDDTPDAGYFLPPLTTVRQDFAELGRRSLDLLLAQLDAAGHQSAPERVLLLPHLVVRASSAAPPQSS